MTLAYTKRATLNKSMNFVPPLQAPPDMLRCASHADYRGVMIVKIELTVLDFVMKNQHE